MKPKYELIADVLRDRIKTRVYPPDSMLPNQTDFVEEFQVSRMTIKKAIGILVMEGLVYAQQGLGTKVLNNSFWSKYASPANVYQGLSKQMKKEKRDLQSQVILFEVIFPDKKIQERLLIDESQPVYKIIRLRIIDEEPSVLEHTYMSCDLIPGLTFAILEKSIYHYIQHSLHLIIAGAYRNFQAAKPDPYDQQYLNCQKDDPILEVEQVVYLKDGRPLEYSRSRNRYDTRSYSILDILSQ